LFAFIYFLKKDIHRLRLHRWYFAFTVGELNLGDKELLGTILESDPAIEAFKFMNNRVRGKKKGKEEQPMGKRDAKRMESLKKNRK
jgi:hypothetical protein